MDSKQVTKFIDDLLEKVSSDLMLRYSRKLKSHWKPDHSRATDADTAAENIIVSTIKDAFPNDAILSEECGFIEGQKSGHSESFLWIVDPLDGTANFFHKIPHFAVSIARCQRQGKHAITTTASGISFPAQGHRFLANRDLGQAWLDGKVLPPINLGKKSLQGSFLGCGLAAHENADIYQRDLSIYAELNKRAEAVRRNGASALDLAMVAEGVFSGFWQRRLEPWDMAAAILMIELVGGKIVNYPAAGQPTNEVFDLYGQGILAGHPQVVDEILGVFREIDG